MFTVARINLYVLLATYLLSAGILYVGRRQGRPVTWFIIGAWTTTAVGGTLLTDLLQDGSAWVWWALFIVLPPLMVYSLIGESAGTTDLWRGSTCLAWPRSPSLWERLLRAPWPSGAGRRP